MPKIAVPMANTPILDDVTWRKMARLWRGSGVVSAGNASGPDYAAALAVTADASGFNVKVGAGEAYLDGGYYADDTVQRTLAINAPDATNPRIDRVVLRWDGPNNLADLVVLQGTPAASPAVPTLTQNRGGRWEEALAQVRVNVGVTNIAAGAVTDERRFTGGVSAADGTAALPGLFFVLDLDTGLSRPAANTLAFSTGGVERLRIEANGDSRVIGNLRVSRIGDDSQRFVRLITDSGNPRIDSGPDAPPLLINWFGGSNGMQVGNGFGNYGPIAASAFNVGSSREFKENIRSLSRGLGDLLKLTPKGFTFKGNKREQFGFIAEEVAPVVPELVVDGDFPQFDQDGKQLPGVARQALDVMGLLATAVQAIKDQQAAIVALTQRATALDARVRKLEGGSAPSPIPTAP